MSPQNSPAGEDVMAENRSSEELVFEELRRAALFRLLALMMAEPAMAGPARVCEAVARLPHREPVPQSLGRDVWRPAVEAWREAEAEPAALEAEYDRLFRRNMACPPHETAYGDGRRMGGRPAELADIRGFYEAFGMVPSSASPDLPDHLAAELEFCAILLLKSAHARCADDAERLEVTSTAAASFLRDHLGRWPRAFRQAVEAEGAWSPYRETARLIESAIAAECRRLDVVPRLVDGAGPSDPLAHAETFTCPMAARCGGQEGV
jgi:putative dimethyl sulfoxide reductase chaperone